MSEIAVFSFRIEDGVIVSVQELRSDTRDWPVLSERGDIEDAVARVANTPVGGKEEPSRQSEDQRDGS